MTTELAEIIADRLAANDFVAAANCIRNGVWCGAYNSNDVVVFLYQNGFRREAAFYERHFSAEENGTVAPTNDSVNHPSHYTSHPSKIECIEITQHMGFCLGNAMKYIWRADLKNDAIEDLKKAEWYIRKEIEKREKANKAS